VSSQQRLVWREIACSSPAWSLERVNEELDHEITKAWDAVQDAYERYPDATWRDAAYVVALERLAEGIEARGLWP